LLRSCLLHFFQPSSSPSLPIRPTDQQK
jgi:hypothetical protein